MQDCLAICFGDGNSTELPSDVQMICDLKKIKNHSIRENSHTKKNIVDEIVNVRRNSTILVGKTSHKGFLNTEQRTVFQENQRMGFETGKIGFKVWFHHLREL